MNIFSLFKIGTKIYLADFQFFFRKNLRLHKNQKLSDTPFYNFKHLYTFPRVMRGPQQNSGPKGSAVLTFIGYKESEKHQDTQTSKEHTILSKELSLCQTLKFLNPFIFAT